MRLQFFSYFFILVAPLSMISQELIVNGDFETGDFTGWTIVPQAGSKGTWEIYTKTSSPIGGAISPTPHSAVLYQDVVIPPGNASVSYTYYYIDPNPTSDILSPGTISGTVSPNQQIRIDIMAPGSDPFSVDSSDVLLNLLQTPAESLLGPTTAQTDISQFAGQTVRLRFARMDMGSFFEFRINGISIIAIPTDIEIPNYGFNNLMEETLSSIQVFQRLRQVRERMIPNREKRLGPAKYLDKAALLAKSDLVERTQKNDSSMKTSVCSQEALSIYLVPIGSFGNVGKINNQLGYGFYSFGALFGGDYAFSQVGTGMQIGYQQFHGNMNGDQGHFNQYTGFGKVYATFLPMKSHDLYIDLHAGASGNWYDSHRNTFTGVAIGNPSGWGCEGYGAIGYDSYAARHCFTPQLSLQYTHLSIDSYREMNAGLSDNSLASQSMNSLRSWFGLFYEARFASDWAIFTPQIHGFWLHEFLNLNSSVLATATSFNSITNLQLFGGNPDYGVMGAQLEFLFAKRWTASINYDYYWNGTVHANMFFGEIGANF